MTDTNNKIASELFGNPLSIQNIVLEDIQNKLLGGTPVVGVNNVFTGILEAFSTTTADAINEVLNLHPSIYPKRATTATDLYRHISFLDYVGLFATPASCEILISLDKKYLIDYAQDFNDNYKKVTIPTDSVFTIAGNSFGIHYPIDIKINRVTNSIVTSYDTETVNPLHRLSVNTIEHRDYSVNGMELIAIQIPIHQFIKTTFVEDLSPNAGFAKAYTFDDQFYALRAHHYIDGSWQEMDQTLAEDTYNSDNPTIKMVVEFDTNRIKITIPQVYFSNDLMGSKLKIAIFSTKGEIDIDIGQLSAEDITTNYVISAEPEENKYSKILHRIPTQLVAPLSYTIAGGGNGISFEEFRARVVNDSFTDGLLVSHMERQKAFEAVGFVSKQYVDNITDRIYLCFKELIDPYGSIIPSGNIPTRITRDVIANTATIKNNLEGSITILPTTVYKYVDDICLVLTDTETTELSVLPKTEKIAMYNNNIYTKCPFHVRVNITDKYPLAESFDLSSPVINRIEHIAENINVSSQLSIYSAAITHKSEGTGGFEIKLVVTPTDDILELPIEDIVVYLDTDDAVGPNVHMEATYSETIDGKYIYIIGLTTNYDLDVNHNIILSPFNDLFSAVDVSIPLKFTLRASFMVHGNHIDSISAKNTPLKTAIAPSFNEYVPLLQQNIYITLGEHVEYVFSRVDLMYTSEEYARHQVSIPVTYQSTVYETDAQGIPIYTTDVDGNIVLVPKYNQGDQMQDANGDLIWLHEVGDIILDSKGNPTIAEDRELIYNVDMLHVSARLTLSEADEHAGFMSMVTQKLRQYFDTIAPIRERLLEKTKLYFQPIRSIGTGLFKLDSDTHLEVPLELELSLKLHVYEFVAANNQYLELLRTSILKLIDRHLATGIFSLTAIAKEIRESMSEHVREVDILGINNDPTLQTLISAGDDSRPSLRQQLVVMADKTIGIERQLILRIVTT